MADSKSFLFFTFLHCLTFRQCPPLAFSSVKPNQVLKQFALKKKKKTDEEMLVKKQTPIYLASLAD